MSHLNHPAPPRTPSHCDPGQAGTNTWGRLCLCQWAGDAFYQGLLHWWLSWTWRCHQTGIRTNTKEENDQRFNTITTAIQWGRFKESVYGWTFTTPWEFQSYTPQSSHDIPSSPVPMPRWCWTPDRPVNSTTLFYSKLHG